jgi:hypothetical protein
VRRAAERSEDVRCDARRSGASRCLCTMAVAESVGKRWASLACFGAGNFLLTFRPAWRVVKEPL